MATRNRKKAAAARAAAAVDHDEIIAALEVEKAGYEQRGLSDRAKAVQTEIGKHKRAGGSSSGTSGSAKPQGTTGTTPADKAGQGPPAGSDKPAGTTGSAKTPAGDGKAAAEGSGAKDS